MTTIDTELHPLSRWHKKTSSYQPRVCCGENRTKEQSNGVPENLRRKMVLGNRAIYQDWRARIIIVARRSISTLRPGTFMQTVLHSNLPCRQPYIFANHQDSTVRIAAMRVISHNAARVLRRGHERVRRGATHLQSPTQPPGPKSWI
jgi:hypothetical protein